MEIVNSSYKIVGVVKVTVTEADGTVVSLTYYNTVTNYLRQSLAKWLSGTPNSGTGAVLPPTQIGAGTGTGTPAATDTSLWAPIAGTQRACDTIQVSQGYYAQFNLTYQTTDPAATYTELGLFDSANNLWAHVSINQYKSASQTLTAQWMVYMVADTANTSAIVTNFMRSAFAKWMTGTTTATVPAPTKVQLGTGTGTVGLADTALWTATASTNKACDFVQTVSTYNVQFACTYQDADPKGTFTEAGWLDAAGNLWMHGTINANKQSPNLLSVVGQVGVVGN